MITAGYLRCGNQYGTENTDLKFTNQTCCKNKESIYHIKEIKSRNIFFLTVLSKKI